MKRILYIFLIMAVAFTVFRSEKAVACHKGNRDCVEIPSNMVLPSQKKFFESEGGWTFSDGWGSAGYYTTDPRRAIRGILYELSQKEATFLLQGINDALSKGQKIYMVGVYFDDKTGDVEGLYVEMENARTESLSYKVSWSENGFRGDRGGLKVRDDGGGDYTVWIPNSKGMFEFSAYGSITPRELVRFMSGFGLPICRR